MVFDRTWFALWWTYGYISNCVNSEECALLLRRNRSSYDAGLFKLKENDVCSNEWKSWCTAINLCFNKSFKILYHFTRHQLGLQTLECDAKMMQLDCLSRINSTRTSNVHRNQTPRKKVRLLGTPIPQT